MIFNHLKVQSYLELFSTQEGLLLCHDDLGLVLLDDVGVLLRDLLGHFQGLGSLAEVAHLLQVFSLEKKYIDLMFVVFCTNFYNIEHNIILT